MVLRLGRTRCPPWDWIESQAPSPQGAAPSPQGAAPSPQGAAPSPQGAASLPPNSALPGRCLVLRWRGAGWLLGVGCPRGLAIGRGYPAGVYRRGPLPPCRGPLPPSATLPPSPQTGLASRRGRPRPVCPEAPFAGRADAGAADRPAGADGLPARPDAVASRRRGQRFSYGLRIWLVTDPREPGSLEGLGRLPMRAARAGNAGRSPGSLRPGGSSSCSAGGGLRCGAASLDVRYLMIAPDAAAAAAPRAPGTAPPLSANLAQYYTA